MIFLELTSVSILLFSYLASSCHGYGYNTPVKRPDVCPDVNISGFSGIGQAVRLELDVETSRMVNLHYQGELAGIQLNADIKQDTNTVNIYTSGNNKQHQLTFLYQVSTYDCDSASQGVHNYFVPLHDGTCHFPFENRIRPSRIQVIQAGFKGRNLRGRPGPDGKEPPAPPK